VILQIDYTAYQSLLRIQKSEQGVFVFDPIRKKNIVLTPEELLRQLVLQYLMQEMQYSLARIRVEIGIELHGMKKRCDIVVFDRALQPWLLIECKSPKVALTQKTFEQAAAYNLRLQVPFLAITNGPATFCCRMDYEERRFEFMKGFPEIR
jgi:hypothetical protein